MVPDSPWQTIGTALLTLPVATETGTSTDLVTALFTAVLAVCVTGLIVVDTPTYWSTFVELAILSLIQAGGIGIMTLATLLGLLVQLVLTALMFLGRPGPITLASALALRERGRRYELPEERTIVG